MFRHPAITRTTISALMMSVSGLSFADEWAATYTGESAHNLHGGAKTGSVYLGNFDFTALFDQQAWLPDDAAVFVYFLGNHGDSPSEKIGDAQTFSNIDAPQAFKLYEFWYEQTLGVFGFKIGLQDLNAEFDSMETAGLFQNSSFGIGPDYSQSGGNGPSIFPTTSAGLRLAFAFANIGYSQCVALDGVPGDPDNERGTHIKFDSGDGLLFNCEGGIRQGADESGAGLFKLGLGRWQYSEPSDHLDGAGASKNSGWYLIGERELWRGEARSLAGFARLGFADDAVNQFARYQGAGVVLSGVFSEGDSVGVGIASVENSDAFIDSEAANGTRFERRETTLELVYRVAVTDWLTLQPSLQWIKNPGMDPALDDSLAFALRFELSQSGGG